MKLLAILLSSCILFQSFVYQRGCSGASCHFEKKENLVNGRESIQLEKDKVKLQRIAKETLHGKKCCKSHHRNDENDKDDSKENTCCGDFCKCCGKMAKNLILHFVDYDIPFDATIYSANCFHYQLLFNNIDTTGIFHPPISA